MVTLGNTKSVKSVSDFKCILCDYNTCVKQHYEKHLKTLKHQQVMIGNKKSVKSVKSVKNNIKYICDNCGKEYYSRKGLWQHNKDCHKKEIVSNYEKKEKEENMKDLFMYLIKENSEIMKNTMIDIMKSEVINNNIVSNNTINSNNKAFNLNFFLNETCKDAMNMSEFINSLQIEYNDFEKVGEIGFVNGISNIIIKNLKDLDITQRPLHCTDKKREVMYVKEDNKWEKEDENYTKTRKLIKKTADKNMRLLPEFREKYPDYTKSSSKYSDMYDLLIIETMGGSGDNDLEKETKILKNIAREVFVDKTL